MTLSEYQQAAQRTAAGPFTEMKLAVAALGLTGEAGEVAEIIKKHLGHGHPLKKEWVINELGDVLWYVAHLSALLGVDLGTVAAGNIEKLRARYPEGFSHEASQNRGDK